MRLAGILLLVLGTASAWMGESPPPELRGGGGAVRLGPGTPWLTTGIYVLVRSRQVAAPVDADMALVAMLRQDWVDGLALSLTWEDWQPTPDVPDGAVLERSLAAIDAAARLAGRVAPVPVFLKLLPTPPAWARGDEPPADDLALRRNRLGMAVLRRPARMSEYGAPVAERDVPFSHDAIYHEHLRRLMACIGAALLRLDPTGERIPMLQVIGPAMDCFQMRVPDPARWPDEGGDPWGAGWSKPAHLAAWRACAAPMAAEPGFANRLWVFNVETFQAARPGALALTPADELPVAETFAAAHPAGPWALLLKSESLCVDFDRRLAQRGAATPAAVRSPNSRWAHQFTVPGLDANPDIAARRFGHGWEMWASVLGQADVRAPAMYPLDQLARNALCADPTAAGAPADDQGTLWLETWMQEARAPEQVRRFDDDPTPIADAMRDLRRRLRAGLQRLAEGR